MSPTQLTTCTGEQGILFGSAQIGHPDPGWIQLTTRGSGSDDGPGMPATMGDHRRLDAGTVDTVDHPIRGRQERIHVVDRNEILDARDSAFGIDLPDPLLQDTDLGSSKSRSERRQLPVDIRFDNMIHVDQGQMTDSAPGEGLHCPGSHTPHADNDNMRIPEVGIRPIAIETPDTAETPFHLPSQDLLKKAPMIHLDAAGTVTTQA